ncbi:PAS domain-containing protein [candidate division KSB1 bacterium]|nr:PAS domain-containing protein [candidate division KSB1 bacterium]
MNDTANQNAFKKISRLQPSYIVIIAVVLIIALVISGIIELSHTRREIYLLMEEEAATLHQALQLSASNAISSYDEIEYQVGDKLLAVSRLVDRLDRSSRLSTEILSQIAAENGILRINIFDDQGNKILSNVKEELASAIAPDEAYRKYILPLQQAGVNELVLGIVESRHESEQRYAIIVRRTNGGVIVTNIDPSELLAFRRSIGVGKLMQDVGAYENFVYIVLQDEEGILLATENVAKINSIESDPFLVSTLMNATSASRYFDYDSDTIFEFVGPFILNDEPIGLFRLGLITDHLEEASQRIRRRLILMSLAIGAFILIMFNLLTINQNYHLVKNAYHRIQTYTGNILEHMADAVVAINRNHEITIFNEAASRLFNVSADDILNKKDTLDLPEKVPALITALETGETVLDLEDNMSVDDSMSIISINTSVIRQQNGDIESAFAVIKDLTEKRRLEETIKRKEKLTAMGQLASGVAHEIRNPLNAIGLISQRLHKEFEPVAEKEEFSELTKTMVNEVRRINDIIKQFLTIARPPKLNRAPTDINEVLRSINLLVNAGAREKNITIAESFSDLPVISVDESQIRQAILNIVQNAIEAIEGSGELRVATELNDDDVCIKITDSGPGMDETTLSKIFNLYYTTKPHGTGLGLSIAHQIVAQHDGRIHVDSKKDVGTTFMIFLPKDV